MCLRQAGRNACWARISRSDRSSRGNLSPRDCCSQTPAQFPYSRMMRSSRGRLRNPFAWRRALCTARGRSAFSSPGMVLRESFAEAARRPVWQCHLRGAAPLRKLRRLLFFRSSMRPIISLSGISEQRPAAKQPLRIEAAFDGFHSVDIACGKLEGEIVALAFSEAVFG